MYMLKILYLFKNMFSFPPFYMTMPFYIYLVTVCILYHACHIKKNLSINKKVPYSIFSGILTYTILTSHLCSVYNTDICVYQVHTCIHTGSPTLIMLMTTKDSHTFLINAYGRIPLRLT